MMVALFCATAVCAQQAATLPGTPFWQGQRVDRETVLFEVERGKTAATAHLLFTPSEIESVTSTDGSVHYEEGRDYIWRHGQNLLRLPAGSRIPQKTWAEMHLAVGAPMSLPAKNGKTAVFFVEGGKAFANLQVNVTYRHTEAWTGFIPQPKPGKLGRTLARLHAGLPVRIVVLGDSISAGYNASSTFGRAPLQPDYAQMFANALHSRFGSPVEMTNLSVAGMNSAWGAKQVDKVVAAKPDLVVIAFGMNDASQNIPAHEYAANIAAVMNETRKALPDAEFVLVATMMGNPEWATGADVYYRAYQQALLAMENRHTAVADVTSLWGEMLKRKKFVDLTGNGVNHPNDFGHRVYAQVLLSLFE